MIVTIVQERIIIVEPMERLGTHLPPARACSTDATKCKKDGLMATTSSTFTADVVGWYCGCSLAPTIVMNPGGRGRAASARTAGGSA